MRRTIAWHMIIGVMTAAANSMGRVWTIRSQVVVVWMNARLYRGASLQTAGRARLRRLAAASGGQLDQVAPLSALRAGLHTMET